MIRPIMITGASGGIGRACVEEFSHRKHRIIALAHSHSSGERLKADGRLSDVEVADFRDVGSLRAAVDALVNRCTEPAVLINNAGVLTMSSSLDLSEEAWNMTIDVNLKATFFLCQAVAKAMKTRGSGVIVNVGSVAGIRGLINQTAYSVAKAGVHVLTRVLAQELYTSGIRVYCIAPGAVDTPMLQECLKWSADQTNTQPERMLAMWLESSITKRLISPSNIAKAIAFLASGPDELTGTCISADSGVS